MTSLIQTPADNRGPTLLAPVRIWCRVGGDPRTEDGPFPISEMIRLDRRGRLPEGLEARTRWGRWMPWPDLRRALAARAPRGRVGLAAMLAGLVLALLPGAAQGQRVVGTAASASAGIDGARPAE